jgi:hypothetical protein
VGVKRHLLILAAVLGLLLIIDFALDRSATSRRQLAAAVRPVVGADPQRAQTLRIAQDGHRWEYVLRDSVWRYPAYFDAYVQRPRLDQFLRSVMTSSGSVVADDAPSASGFGFGDAGTLEVAVLDAQGRNIVTARLGRGIPGALGSESYLRKSGEDTIFHLHASPRLALDAAAVPMIDRHLLPEALRRGAIVRVTFPDRTAALDSLWREDLPPDLGTGPMRGPSYRWRARLGGLDTTCVDNGVYAYLSYLTRVSYDRLLPPGDFGKAAERARVVMLEDDKGVIDTLEVVGGEVAIVRHRLARQIATLTDEQAALIFPAPSALLDTLGQPSIYDRAAPRQAGMF